MKTLSKDEHKKLDKWLSQCEKTQIFDENEELAAEAYFHPSLKMTVSGIDPTIGKPVVDGSIIIEPLQNCR